MNQSAMATHTIGQIRRQHEQQHGDDDLRPVLFLGKCAIEVSHLRRHGEREEGQHGNDPGHAEHAQHLEELLFQGMRCIGVHGVASLKCKIRPIPRP